MINITVKFTSLLLATSLLTMLSGCRSKKSSEDEVAYTRTQNYRYADLILKDYDEMQGMVRNLIRKAQASGGEGPAVEHLQSALKLVFSRPDSDNMVSKLTAEVRRELAGYGAFERVIAQLAAEATDNLNDKNNTVSVRTTASFILENLLAEIRPDAEREPNDMRKVVRAIADAGTELPRDVRSERTLRGMYRSNNPGDEARRIMKGIEDRERAAKKQAQEDAKRARREEKERKKAPPEKPKKIIE